MIVGMNLARATYYQTNTLLADIMILAKDWSGGGGRSGLGFPIDVPSGDRAMTYIYAGLNGKYPKGKYRLTVQGTCNLRVKAGDTVSRVVDGIEDIEFYPTSSSGIEISVDFGSVSNMSLFRDGNELGSSALLGKQEASLLSPFRVLRVMDFIGTNEQRHPILTAQRFNTIEMADALEVCSDLGAIPWVNVPHNYRDNPSYLPGLFKLLERFDSYYLEYSNEVWNGIFPQYLTDPADYAEECLSLFNQIPESHRQKVIKVVAGQAASTWKSQEILKQFNSDEFDVFAIGAYAGHSVSGVATTTGMLSAVEAMGSKTRLQKSILEDLHPGKELVAYEGGFHLRGLSNYEWGYSEDAGQVAKKLLETWDEASGGGLFMWFHSMGSPFDSGDWGLIRKADDHSPRYNAVVNFIRAQEPEPEPDSIMTGNLIAF